MTTQEPSSDDRKTTPDGPTADPWRSFSYIVSGVLAYGLLGWLADRWLGTTFLVAIGILVGAGLGIYMTFARYNRASPSKPPSTPPT
ncbi:hypothetical protein INN71_04425 [Nocardioides sp. ChNu-153]|uniref:AtpZ/AtpI family protein n=1 Tax=unclassified Nocardioides TaxID=2615069 RepID=UPI002404CE73|nr:MULTISPECIES: hypothetical protein [unclassified Nocardioides]MDF9715470.1 hypothetical protein [Nocardioides sp. ChNu-99]MDN7120633.1 hypothetical protein [Nocardioides sp. ChNu-153]